MHIRFLISSILLFICDISVAQIFRPLYNEPSPNAASLGEYSTVPISHFTGVPEVSVPLYEIEAGEFKYPVSLSYHLSSVKPNALPGCVGLGWTMMADACITRTVRGAYDEKTDLSGVHHGYYWHHNKMLNITAEEFEVHTMTGLVSYDNQSNWYELSADEFSFYVNGHSGNFYLSPSGQWIVVSDEDIKVEFNPQTDFLTQEELCERMPEIHWWSNKEHNGVWFKRFTLITPDGIRYEFGGVNAIDFSIPYYNRNNGDLVATSWHLTKITTPQGRIISFEYSPDEILADIRYVTGETICYGFEASSASYLHRDIRGRSALGGFLLFPVSLSRITGPNDELEFTYMEDESYRNHLVRETLFWGDESLRVASLYLMDSGNPWVHMFELLPVSVQDNEKANQKELANCMRHNLLHRIAISNTRGGNDISWYFEYSGKSRKKLTDLYCRAGVPMLSMNNEGWYNTPLDNFPQLSKPEWHFRYNVDPWIMPYNFVYPATDAWGYWKGGVNSPSLWISSSPYAAQVRYSSAETLREIYYPTGGKTVFEYEHHDYSKVERASHGGVDNQSGEAGGLRVKTLTNIDRLGSIKSKIRYHYKTGFNSNSSSGIALAVPADSIHYSINQERGVVIKSSEGFQPSATNHSTPFVGYSTVIEELVNEADSTLGYIIYRYSNFDEDIFGQSHPDEVAVCRVNLSGPSIYDPYTSNSAERGKLQSKEYYTADKHIVRREQTRYGRVNNEAIPVADQRFVIFHSDPYYYAASHIGWISLVRTYSYLPTEIETTDYCGTESLTRTATYSYNSHKLVSLTERTTSDGSLRTQARSYAYEDSLHYAWMNTAHYLDYPSLETLTTRDGTKYQQNEYSYVQGYNAVEHIPYISRATSGMINGHRPKTHYETSHPDRWGNPGFSLSDSLITEYSWVSDGQRIGSLSLNPGDLEAFNLQPTNPLDGFLFTSFTYNGNLLVNGMVKSNGYQESYDYDQMGRLASKEYVHHSDTILNNSFQYEYAHTTVPRDIEGNYTVSIPQNNSGNTLPGDVIPDQPIRGSLLETGFSSQARLNFITEAYHLHNPSNRLDVYVNDTVHVNFRGTLFSYYHDSGRPLPEGTIPLKLDLYKQGAPRDSLVGDIRLQLNCSTMCIEAPNGSPTGGNEGFLQTLSPGNYSILFQGLAFDSDFEEAVSVQLPLENQTLSMINGIEDEDDPVDPDNPDDPMEYAEHYPSFTLVMECLPLIEQEFEEEIIPSVTTWNSIRHFKSSDGTPTQGNTTIQWMDDFGKQVATSARGASPAGDDWVSFTEYDGWGRSTREWLPSVIASVSQVGMPDLNDYHNAYANTYGASEEPYSITEYEQSPLSRKLKEYGPGADWHRNGKYIRKEYLFNRLDLPTLMCRLFECSCDLAGRWSVTSSGYYESGTLYVTRTTNEDGNQVLEFKDFDDKTILSRSVLGNEYLDTYYVYDGFGNLLAVLPPLASSAFTNGRIPERVLEQFAYLYSYDERDCCTVKKLPGADPTYYVYDGADRIILTQDGNMRRNGIALFSLYDIFGREVMKGECSNPVTPGMRISSVTKATYIGPNGSFKGYIVNGISLNNPELLSVQWYDKYSFVQDVFGLNLTSIDLGLPSGTAAESASNLRTGIWNADLGGSKEVSLGRWCVFIYDWRNRVAKTLSHSFLTGSSTMEEVQFTHRSSLAQRHIVHSGALDTLGFTEDYNYDYDHMERLLGITHSINGGSSASLIRNTYDDLGRLSATMRNNIPSLSATQDYNIRSWTRNITSPFFTESIGYNDVLPNTEGIPQWSGIISSIQWNEKKSYGFSYDGLGRLVSAIYNSSIPGDSGRSRQYQYDSHFNIVAIDSEEKSSIQQLEYIGNQLSSAQYDSNGNATSAPDIGILHVKYNILNLPDEIIKANGDTVRYIYGADSVKLRETVFPFSDGDAQPSAIRTDYVSNLVYRNGLLGRILVDGGAVVARDSTLTPAYEFSFTDHLGNVRALVTVSDSLYRRTDYDPYGNIIEETYSSDNLMLAEDDDEENAEEIDEDVENTSPSPTPTPTPPLTGSLLPDIPRGLICTQISSPYRYGGKEYLESAGLDLYDFGARQYSTMLPRWLTMDPKAEKFYGMSPYTYCAGNPVNLVDEKGYNWYLFFDKEGKEQYRYYEGKLTEEEVKQGGYRDLGFTYSSKTDYYSLFGRKLSYSSKDGLIAQLYKNIDNLIITYFTNSSDADGRIRHVDMSLKEKGLISFSYNGLSFSSIKGVGPGHSAIGDGTLFYSVDTKNAQSYIIRFPEKETALASYHRKFKGYWLLAANGIGSNEGFLTLQIKFDRTNACRFLKSVNHLFGKNYTFE